MDGITAAGSVFLGDYAPVPVGDYFSGTNHVLPTGRAARRYSGLSVVTFMRRFTYQEIDKGWLSNSAESIAKLATAEGLHEHARAVTSRFS